MTSAHQFGGRNYALGPGASGMADRSKGASFGASAVTQQRDRERQERERFEREGQESLKALSDEQREEIDDAVGHNFSSSARELFLRF